MAKRIEVPQFTRVVKRYKILTPSAEQLYAAMPPHLCTTTEKRQKIQQWLRTMVRVGWIDRSGIAGRFLYARAK